MSGPKERMCQGDGGWSGRAPECKKQPSCSSPPGVPHSRTNASDSARDFVINSTVRYTCFPGYDAKGFDVAKCIFYNGSAQWFGPDLKCDPKSCGPPGEVEHGRRMGAMTRFTSSVKYECHEGYELFGRAHRYCQSSGQWSGTLPECRPVQCDKPEDPLNGRAIFDQLLFNSVVRYECHHGFRLKGPSTARCNSQRQWEGAPTHCVEIDCGHPGHLHNGYVEFRSSTLNAKATYNCFDGMKFQGDSNTSICLDTGNWSSPLPKCLAPCKIPTLEHAYVNLSTPESRLEHGRRLSVSCHDHYELAYNSTPPPPRCNNGSWTHLPICAPARCKSLPERPAHGFVIAPKTDHGMRALFRCTDGYQLVGPNVTVCQFGNWTHEAVPLCRETTCSLPEVPNGSFRELTTERPLDPAELIGHGTLVELVCAGGFQVQGQPELRCWQGEWTPGLLPECLPEPCELPALRGGRYLGGYRTGLTISPGSSVEYACDEPHLRQWPPSPLRCRMGRLQPAPPTCLPPPQKPSATSSSLGAAPEEAPRPESVPVAAVEEAQWSTASPGPPSGGDAVPRRATPPPPSDKPCSAPERLHNALAYRSSSPSKSEEDGEEDSRGLLQFPHGTEVVFRCIDSAGGGKRSTWKLLCEDGSWLGRPEKCEDGAQQLSVPKEERRNRSCVFRNTEPNLEAFQGDRRITDDTLHFPPGSELVFRCKDIGKYSLVGSVRRRCVYGDWDGVKPSCFGLSQENDYALEKPPTILFRPHVMPVAQSNDGKLVVYPGAILHLECLWLRKYGTPKWEVSHKSRKYAEENGYVESEHGSQYRGGQQMQFTCRPDHMMLGAAVLECLDNDHWSGTVPECVPACQYPSVRDGARILSRVNYFYRINETVSFECPENFQLRGSPMIQCVAKGRWSAAVPRCQSFAPSTASFHERRLRRHHRRWQLATPVTAHRSL
ncbi:sushi, von Willebrand factor type A, EGF and pentraxin domain-containing protein 1-like [Rhipicephalus microplus]|uniref:sushi, von Willebrand factor type A, EGF and pentraxin domain-containing protein 1-like n=1 Tax=Rhipicephalus microplus TaxID=6941 RepID=UPI003F6B5529